MSKFLFQVITSTHKAVNPVISAPDEYEAFHVLIGYCRNNDIMPVGITLVQKDEDEEDIPCYIDDEPLSYWHKF